MAKVKYGEMIAALSGKIGGTVHSKNHYGNFMRVRVKPTNPQTSAQVESRNVLKAAAQAWRGLTDAQRGSWINLASTVSKTDRLGDAIKLTGSNLYVSAFKLLTLCGESTLDVAPVQAAVESLTSISGAQTTGTGALTLTFAPAIPSGYSMVLEATKPLSAGVKFVKSNFRKIAVYSDSVTSPKAFTTDYTNKFGANLQPGEIAFVRAYFINPAYPVVSVKLQSARILGIA
jgi:hypothetical protein